VLSFEIKLKTPKTFKQNFCANLPKMSEVRHFLESIAIQIGKDKQDVDKYILM